MQAKAEESLRAERYRDAIDQYKALLRKERNPAWVKSLAQAYAGRANQLAAKDMFKEALAVWRARAEVCAVQLELGPCLSWLMRLGEWEQVFGILSGAESLPQDVRKQAETQLARTALSASEDVLLKFPSSSPLVLHRSGVLAALAAYANGDATAMNAHLASIPFRSPFRDLRAILKALQLLSTDVLQATAVIERISAGSPFEPLVAALRLCALPGDEWLAALGNQDQETRSLVLDIKGCPAEQRAVVTELSMLRNQPAAVYDLVVRHRHVFPPGAAAQLCLRLLPSVPGNIKAYGAKFVPLPGAEQQRILALAAELKNNFDPAEGHWNNVIQSMAVGQPVRAALILNHMANAHHHGGKPGELCEHGVELLERSLDLDAADRDTHLRLIRALRIAAGDPGELGKRLDDAVERFPGDAEILLEAMDSAVEGGAFEKGAALASRVLHLDAINPKARSALDQAHLSQARKHIMAGNPEGARRELEEAGRWLRDEYGRAAIKLLQAFAAEEIEQNDAPLRAVMADLGGNLLGIFHLLLEAGRTQRNGMELLRRTDALLEATPSVEEMLALANGLNTIRVEDAILRGALAPLENMIKRAARLTFTEPECLLVCEALHRREQTGLTRRYAEAALKRWPGRPVFVYLRAAAMSAEKAGRMPRKERIALEKAWDAAQSQGDERTMSRLAALLTELEAELEGFGPKGGQPAMPDPGSPSFAAAMDAMIATGGEDVFLDMARKQIPKSMFEDLRRKIGGDKKHFARRLMGIFSDPWALLGGSGAPDQGPIPKFSGAPAPRNQRPVPPGQKDFFDD